MGFLTDLFDDVVEIASFPVKLSAKIVDDIVDSDIASYVDELKDTIKIDNK